MNSVTLAPSYSVWARHGMVASGHPMASQAGLSILRDGGSAADAALGMALATAVVMPDMCGLGGEAFSLYRSPKGPLVSYQGSGKLPRDFDPALLEASRLVLPPHGGPSISVPGSVDLYLTLHQTHGRLPLAEIVHPAISLAREGFLVDARLAESLVGCFSLIGGNPLVRDRFYPEGKALQQGALLVQPEMALVFEDIVKHGHEGFYEGPWADAMVRAVGLAGGFLSQTDLAEHRTEMGSPLSVAFGPYMVHQTPLPSQGVVMLEALALIADLPIEADWREHPRIVHRVIEALRWAFHDRREYLGDPAHVDFDPEKLLGSEWIDRRRAQLEGHVNLPTRLQSGDTTSLVAADAEGNAVSFIHSLGMPFGSGVFVPEGGFFLNNRSGRSFNTIPGHPNQAVPGKRPMHTLNTYMVTRDRELEIVGNTPGGDGQPQWNLTVLLDLLCGHRLPHEAVALPRFSLSPATDAHTLQEPYLLQMEARFAPSLITGLEKKGHRIEVIGPYAGGGSAQVIRRRPDGYVGASDPRGIGQTLGY